MIVSLFLISAVLSMNCSKYYNLYGDELKKKLRSEVIKDTDDFGIVGVNKGSIARSVFYFYTLYPEENIKDLGNINDLLIWNADFDVSDEETNAIVNAHNPYLKCPELVFNAFIDHWNN